MSAESLDFYTYPAPVPWANEANPLLVPQGTSAVVPEIDVYGNKTGEYVRLSHQEYLRELGSAGILQLPSDGDPERALAKIDQEKMKHPLVSTAGMTVPEAPPIPRSIYEPAITSEQGE